MTTDDDTKPGTKLARLVADGVQARLEAMLQQPEVLDALAFRIANEVRAGVKDDLRQVRAAQLAYESRTQALEDRVANLEAIVRSPALQRVVRFAAESMPREQADTEPPTESA